MTELRGLVDVRGTRSVTCCDSLPNIYIGGVELYQFILDLCELDSPIDEDECYTDAGIKDWRVEYCTSNSDFTDASFRECATNKVIQKIYSTAITGCYSVWTCGSGGYDFLISNKEGHSLLQELASYHDQYVWINFGDSDSSEIPKSIWSR